MSPSPRAIEQYLACESMRTLGLVIWRMDAMRAFVPWSEWPASTDSQNEAAERSEMAAIEIGESVGDVSERCEGKGWRGFAAKRRLSVCTHLERALALDGDKDDSLLALGVLEVDREVRAAHHSDDDLAVEQEPEADGVLSTTEEALGSINRVQRPVACTRSRRS